MNCLNNRFLFNVVGILLLATIVVVGIFCANELLTALLRSFKDVLK